MVDLALKQHPEVRTVAMVHHETTLGLINPVKEIAEVVDRYGRVFMLDLVDRWAVKLWILPEIKYIWSREPLRNVFKDSQGRLLFCAKGLYGAGDEVSQAVLVFESGQLL